MKEKKELADYEKKLELRIRTKGISMEYVEARVSLAKIYIQDGDYEKAFETTKKAKNEICAIVKASTKMISPDRKGLDIFSYDRYCQEREVETRELQVFWEILLMESHHKFDSYLLYLERKRQPSARFYLPKRKQFRRLGLIQSMQDLEDDKLDILSISMPPGTQKCQPLYSKVLTPDGFITMGEVKVGTKVIAGNGNVATVLSTSPIKKRPIYELELADGKQCRCSDNHLWLIENDGKQSVIEFTEVMKLFYRNKTVKIPIVCKNSSHKRFVPIVSIKFVGDDECKCIFISDPCHLYVTDDFIITHNTTLEKFFASWVIGKHPDDYSLFYSHSDDITRMFYDGVLDITTNDVEYTFNEIFPNVHLESKDAKREQINFNAYKPFPNLQCASVGGKNAGKVRCNRYLYCDDLIGGIEEALNKSRLDTLWAKYSVDARQRKLNEQVKEIHIATRWSTVDVIGRLKNLYYGNDRARFIAVPDIDPVTGKSNFDYEYNGMSVEFFKEQERVMDDISYRCLYKNEPIEREGVLYHTDDVRRFMTLPEREPDAIIGVCDVKNKGTDFMVLPCMFQYGEDFYMVDCVCDDTADYGIQYEKLTNLILRNNMQQVEFESNSGGDRVSYEVANRLAQFGARCNITDKPTETNKETRIIVNADWVKKHVLFKDSSLYTSKSDYGIFMDWLFRFSTVGKNLHDDIPDALANFALYVTRGEKVAKVGAAKNPFRSSANNYYGGVYY